METRARRSSFRIALLALLLGFACDRGNKVEPPAAPVDKPADKPIEKPIEKPAAPPAEPEADKGGKQMSWMDVARLGQFMPPTAVDDAAKQLAGRPNNLKGRAEPVLADMAATSADGAGIKKASARLDGALPSFSDPKNAVGGGDEPDVAAVKQCAFVLYHGLLARAGGAVKAMAKPDDAAIALVDAARGIAGFSANLKHNLMDELMGALGPDLYDHASEALDARKKK